MGVLGKSLSRRMSAFPLAFSVFFFAASSQVLAQSPKDLPSAPEPQSSTQPTASAQGQTSPPSKTEDSSEAERLAAEAVDATKKMGTLALGKARDWESSWLTGVYIGRNEVITPLSASDRRVLYLQQTLTTPGAYLKRMFGAGIDQARGVPRQWDDGWDGYLERFSSREGQFIAANSLAALGNAKLKYEPRYDRCRCKGFWPRTRHAIVRNFITFDETEVDHRPQWALYGGAFGGGLIAAAWKPHPRDPFADGGWAMLEQAGYGSLLNLFIEFAGEINHKIGMEKQTSRPY